METIKSSEEITRLFKTGKRIHSKDFILIVSGSKQHGQIGRAAFIAGKKNGNAVWRNLAKRRMRELRRKFEEELRDYDVLFVAKKSIGAASYDSLLKETAEMLKKMQR